MRLREKYQATVRGDAVIYAQDKKFIQNLYLPYFCRTHPSLKEHREDQRSEDKLLDWSRLNWREL